MDATRPRLARLAEELGQAYRQMLGIPDYPAYLRHLAGRHPEQAPLSRQAFCAAVIERRYRCRGPGCC